MDDDDAPAPRPPRRPRTRSNPLAATAQFNGSGDPGMQPNQGRPQLPRSSPASLNSRTSGSFASTACTVSRSAPFPCRGRCALQESPFAAGGEVHRHGSFTHVGETRAGPGCRRGQIDGSSSSIAHPPSAAEADLMPCPADRNPDHDEEHARSPLDHSAGPRAKARCQQHGDGRCRSQRETAPRNTPASIYPRRRAPMCELSLVAEFGHEDEAKVDASSFQSIKRTSLRMRVQGRNRVCVCGKASALGGRSWMERSHVRCFRAVSRGILGASSRWRSNAACASAKSLFISSASPDEPRLGALLQGQRVPQVLRASAKRLAGNGHARLYQGVNRSESRRCSA